MNNKNDLLIEIEKEDNVIENEQEYSSYIFCVKNEEKELGAARLHINEEEKIAVLKSIFIKEENRGKGIGSFLLFQLEDYVRMHNIMRLSGNISIFSSEEKIEKNINFYKKNGYKVNLGIFFVKEL